MCILPQTDKNCLYHFRQIHMILAQALYSGPQDVKKTILNMTMSSSFPTDEVTAAMVDMQRLVQVENTSPSIDQQMNSNMCFPVISVAKLDMLDDIINQLKVSHKNIKYVAPPTMEGSLSLSL